MHRVEIKKKKKMRLCIHNRQNVDAKGSKKVKKTNKQTNKQQQQQNLRKKIDETPDFI